MAMARQCRVLPALAAVLLLGFAADLPAAATPDSDSRLPARLMAALTPPAAKASEAARMALARHLTAIGARVYTAYWCPHCQTQKAMFGAEAVARLNVIECAAERPKSRQELCKAKRIKALPTWEINGRMETGVLTLEQLANWSGYRGSRLF
jgi:hypothetical protein